MQAAGKGKDADLIDALMERASRHLVHRKYFECEQECAEALTRALASHEYERAARIILPLQEARRQKRDMAFDTGDVFVVDGEVPTGRALKPGCYLIQPPRVGVDARTLREEADKRRIPVIVTVREPTMRTGQWPIVAVGPVTVRTRVPPPSPPAKPAAKGKRTAKSKSETPASPIPTREWFLAANEALGDAAIADIPAGIALDARVHTLYERLAAHPDHEKLHQALEAACRDAARAVAAGKLKPVRRAGLDPLDEELTDDEEAEGEDE